MPRLTIRIDTDTCIAASNCVGIAPKLFRINDGGLAEVLNQQGGSAGHEFSFEATDAEVALAEEAAESCPTRAIWVARG